MVLAIKVRRSSPSFLARWADISPIRCSTCFCGSDWGRGMNSSFETTWVGMGASTPFFRSRSTLGIHISFSLEKVCTCCLKAEASGMDPAEIFSSYRTVGKVAFRRAGVKDFAENQYFVLGTSCFVVSAGELDLPTRLFANPRQSTKY